MNKKRLSLDALVLTLSKQNPVFVREAIRNGNSEMTLIELFGIKESAERQKLRDLSDLLAWEIQRKLESKQILN